MRDGSRIAVFKWPLTQRHNIARSPSLYFSNILSRGSGGCQLTLSGLFQLSILLLGESHGCGTGIVGGRIGGWGIGKEGGDDRVVRNGIRDGLAVSVAFRSIACPFLYTVKVMLFPAILFWPI